MQKAYIRHFKNYLMYYFNKKCYANRKNALYFSIV
jgi:hypothetical protein